MLRYERLDEELTIVARHLGFDLDLPLPRAKGRYRADRRPWNELLTAGERRAIERVRGEDIAVWESLPERYGEMLRALGETPRVAA